jgi:hypothetical protein
VETEKCIAVMVIMNLKFVVSVVFRVTPCAGYTINEIIDSILEAVDF